MGFIQRLPELEAVVTRNLSPDTFFSSSLELGDGLMDGAGNVVDVVGRDATHADAAALQEVDVLLLHQELAHVRRQAGEREHADLEKKFWRLEKSKTQLRLVDVELNSRLVN